MSDPKIVLQEKATTLMTLREGLGPFYDEQKEEIINEALSLPMAQAGGVLSMFLSINFITREELSLLTKRLMGKTAASGAAPAPSPSASAQKPAEPVHTITYIAHQLNHRIMTQIICIDVCYNDVRTLC